MHPRVSEVIDHLDAQRAILRAAFDEVPLASREHQPTPDRWSPAGIIEHLAIIEARVAGVLSARIAAAQVEGLAAETSVDPVLPALNLGRVVNRTKPLNAPELTHPKGLTAEAAWAELERAGELVRAAARSGDGLALGTITHPHPAFGPLSLYEWFGMIGSHEARHAAQIREMSASL